MTTRARRSRLRVPVRPLLAACIAAVAGQASATWSILLVDLKTGEIAIGSATCLTGFDLQANTPVLIPGVGAATAQSFVDTNGFNRSLIRDRLIEGDTPAMILDELSVFDGSHQTRQYGMVDVLGNAATFTGTSAGSWAGGQTGVLPGAGITGGDVLYAIQGNVLWGPDVVADAVDAVREAPGDLPAKLLAGMQAARDAGGDGRCSCSPNDADACIDDEPTGDEKSSDIAYMLTARAGDREGCSPIYRLGEIPAEIEPLGSGRLAVSFAGGAELAIIEPDRRATPPTLGTVRALGPGSELERIGVGDVTGDGLADIVGCRAADDGVWLIPSDAASPTGFGAAGQISPTGRRAVVADLDADGRNDVVIADATGNAVVVLWNDPAGFVASAPVPVGPSPESVAVGDLDGDGTADIAVISSGDATLARLHQTQPRNFQPAVPEPTGLNLPRLIAVVDADDDGENEIAAASLSTARVEIFDRDGTQSSVPLPSNARALGEIDLGQGPRLFVLGLTRSVVLEPFFPGGPLIYGQELGIFQTPRDAALTDLDGDGDTDIATVNLTGRSVRFIDNVGGAFPLTQGCGDGDFFMEFNVAFSQREDPDPVDQLEGIFADWAAGLVGVPDAVRSDATLDDPFGLILPGCTQTLRIDLVDRTGNPAQADAIDISAESGLISIGALTPTGPGSFEVELSAADAPGAERLRIVARLGERSIELMPTLGVIVDDPADLDGDGDRDADDLQTWLAAYQAGDPAADQNLDGSVTPADFNAWVLNARRGC